MNVVLHLLCAMQPPPPPRRGFYVTRTVIAPPPRSTIDPSLAYGHQVAGVEEGERAHIPRADGSVHSEEPQPRPVFENTENQYGQEWLNKTIELKHRLNQDPYYYFARKVAGRTEREVGDLIEDPLKYTRPAAAAAPSPSPLPIPSGPVESHPTSGTSAPRPAAPSATVATAVAADTRWIALPEHLGHIFFKEKLQTATDQAIVDIYMQSGKGEFANNKDFLLHLITHDPIVQDYFVRLVGITLRINEIQTPRRNEKLKLIRPLRLEQLALLLEFKKLDYVGNKLSFGIGPAATSVAPGPWSPVAYSANTERRDRAQLVFKAMEDEYNRNKELHTAFNS